METASTELPVNEWRRALCTGGSGGHLINVHLLVQVSKR
jgi:hypothetical protein